MIRAIIDANVVISGAIAPLGPSASILEAWRADYFELVACPALIAEIAEKLHLPRIQRKYAIAEQQIAELLLRFAQAAYLVPGVATVDAPPNPDDAMLLSASVESDADFIVTGDKPLLGFAWTGRSRIVSPRQFWDNELPRGFIRTLSYPIFALEEISGKGVQGVLVQEGLSCPALFTAKAVAEAFRQNHNILAELLTFHDPTALVRCVENLRHHEKIAFNPGGTFCLTHPTEAVITVLERAS